MLTLRFIDAFTGRTYLAGPAPYFRLAGAQLFEGPQLQLLGAHRFHQWVIGTGSFPLIETRAPTEVLLEESTPSGPVNVVLGTFVSLTIVNGAMWSGPGLGQMVATLGVSESDWDVISVGKSYPAIILRPG